MFSRKSFSTKSFSPTTFRFDITPTPLPPVAGVSGGGYWSFREDRKWGDDFYNLSLLHKQDQEVTELLVSLVTQGFFHE